VLVRATMLVVGLIFLASVLAMALILMSVWLLRALWAKLTGQPVNPWKFQMDRQAMWSRFYRQPGQGRSTGQTAAQRREQAGVIDAEVIDVEPKAIKPSQV